MNLGLKRLDTMDMGGVWNDDRILLHRSSLDEAEAFHLLGKGCVAAGDTSREAWMRREGAGRGGNRTVGPPSRHDEKGPEFVHIYLKPACGFGDVHFLEFLKGNHASWRSQEGEGGGEVAQAGRGEAVRQEEYLGCAFLSPLLGVSLFFSFFYCLLYSSQSSAGPYSLLVLTSYRRLLSAAVGLFDYNARILFRFQISEN